MSCAIAKLCGTTLYRLILVGGGHRDLAVEREAVVPQVTGAGGVRPPGAKVYLSTLNPGEAVNHKMLAGRHAWLQVLRGSVSVNGTLLETSDGLAVSDERSLTIVGERPAEVMLFDLA